MQIKNELCINPLTLNQLNTIENKGDVTNNNFTTVKKKNSSRRDKFLNKVKMNASQRQMSFAMITDTSSVNLFKSSNKCKDNTE